MLKAAELGSEADEDLCKIRCASKSDCEKEMAQGQHLSKKEVVKAVPGQDGTDESKQGIYLFQKRMELEEWGSTH